ncbi:serine/threonine-protein kinase VRK1-like isoform X2 [Monomorium pharaonis]|uniref:serine/threonine-protein kinase VRK1-like isoform X2 n=1 Tax=Monomorium pharaonis TaxID=307658 RepID=UPI001747051F|nr:serine/threonine-protein kinase VRK1-like isoform X2 [Monomorium pharaonis]
MDPRRVNWRRRFWGGLFGYMKFYVALYYDYIGSYSEEMLQKSAPYTGKVPKDNKDYPNVIKIEPHGNGPLFVEMHFYMRNCKSDEIATWQKKKKLTTLGIPRYIASGSHEYKNTKYRFLVIDRYGQNLWKIFEENRQFPEHIVYKLTLQIIDILEYIHHKNYVHADIKGENLLLDWKSYDQVYLVDFGLASRITSSTELKVDPKKAHNGTLQYTSRDAHMGVPTRRGDIEVLSYNMIMWLCGSLPWEKLLDPSTVQKEKEKAFNNIDNFLNKCFQGSAPQAVHKFMVLLASMKFNEIPSYDKLKETLITGLKNLGHKPDGKLKLNSIVSTKQIIPKDTPKKIKKPQEMKKINGVRKSPRKKDVDVPSSIKDSRKSTVGIVIDKKRGNLKDIQKALNEMDSDDEYDIQILKKAKKTDSTERVSTTVKNTIPSHRKKASVDSVVDTEDNSDIEPLRKRLNKTRQKKLITSKVKRKIKSLDDSETTSETEIVSKGTKSRPAGRNKVTTSRLQSNKVISKNESLSDEDIFD